MEGVNEKREKWEGVVEIEKKFPRRALTIKIQKISSKWRAAVKCVVDVRLTRVSLTLDGSH